MKTQETLTLFEINGITNSWIYKAIEDYLDSKDFVVNSDLHGHPRCCEDPMYTYIRLFSLDKDSTNEDDPANIIIKHMFSNLRKNSNKVCDILECNDDYNLEVRNKLSKFDFSLSCHYNDKYLVNCWFDIMSILEQGVESLINAIADSDSFRLYNDLFDGNCDVHWLSRALSYSILSDKRWHNYFKLITNVTRYLKIKL